MVKATMRTLCLLTLTDSMFRANSSQSQSPTTVGVHFFFNFFWHRATHYSNTTDRRNSMEQRSSIGGFALVPDPDGFLGWEDKVDARLGSRVGTRTRKTESVSGFLQALFVVARLRRMKGHATAALGLWKRREIKWDPVLFKIWKRTDLKLAN